MMTETEKFRMLLDERGARHDDISERLTVVPHCEGHLVADEDEEGMLVVSLVREMTAAQAVLALMGPSLLTATATDRLPESLTLRGARFVREDVAETNWYRFFGTPWKAAESASHVADYIEALSRGEEFHSEVTDRLHDEAPYALCHVETLAVWLGREASDGRQDR